MNLWGIIFCASFIDGKVRKRTHNIMKESVMKIRFQFQLELRKAGIKTLPAAT